MTLAFKEWSYIVDALGKGKQSIILRKGGIAEEGGDFSIKGKKFLLLPTMYHQAKDMIKPEWLKLLDGDRFQLNSDEVKIEYFAELADVQVVSDWEKIKRLNSFHAWKEEVIAERYHRWEKKVNLLIVQVYKLENPFVLTLIPEYGGCKSWIELNEDVELAGERIVNKNII
ncbi:MAG TPA: DUF1802 family protein [Cytophagaceae bacterium]